MKREYKISGREITGWLFIALSVWMLIRSVTLCFSNDIWYDELFTVGMIEHSYGELVRFTAADVHPPLYYCIVKFLSDLCKLVIPTAGTVIPAKMASTLPYFILLLYSVTWIRKNWGIFAGGLFFFCVMAMPQLSAYTVEVRMYGWALLFVTAAFLHAYGCVRAGEAAADLQAKTGTGLSESGRRARGRYLHGAALVLYGLAAAYTQYFACVAVVMVYLYLLIALLRRDRSRLREWLCYAAISVIGYVPWLFALAGQISAVSENYWILPLTWRSLGGCVKFVMKPAFANEALAVVLAVVLTAGYMVVVGCAVAVSRETSVGHMTASECRENSVDIWEKVSHNGRVCRRSANKSDAEWDRETEAGFILAGPGVLAGLVLFGFLASILIRPIFVYRYMIPALGCFWLSFAIGLNRILCKPKYKLGIALTVLVLIVGLRDYRAFLGEEEYKIRLMKETEGALAQIGPQDIVLYNFDQLQAVTAYYLPETAERFLWCGTAETLIQELIGPCDTLEETEEIKALAGQIQTAAGEQSLWFLGSFNSREDIVAEWRQAGLVVEEQGSFLLERYWFNLYKISYSDHNNL